MGFAPAIPSQPHLHALSAFLIIAILTGFRWHLTILCLFNKCISVFGYTGSEWLWGPLSSCGAQAFHRGGVSSQSSGFSSCGAQAHLPRSMWGVPGSGAEPASSVLAGGFFTTVTREAPPPFFFFFIFIWLCQISVTECRVFNCVARAQQLRCRLSCPLAYGMLLLVPRAGSKPMAPALEDRFLTTGPPGASSVF